MFDLSEINSAKKKAAINYELLATNFSRSYQEAIDSLKNFFLTNDKVLLQRTTQKLTESLKYQNTRYEPYFLLAYISYLVDNNSLSVNYLRISETLNPSSREIFELKKLLEA